MNAARAAMTEAVVIEIPGTLDTRLSPNRNTPPRTLKHACSKIRIDKTNAGAMLETSSGVVERRRRSNDMAKRITRPWTSEEVEFLRSHQQTLSHAEIGARLGRSEKSVRNHCSRIGLVDRSHDWSEADIALLSRRYAESDGHPLNLEQLAAEFGRTRFAVAMKASKLGLTDQTRPKLEPEERHTKTRMYATDEERRAAMSIRRKEWLRVNGHPRGALGLKHSDETRALLSQRVQAYVARTTHEERQAIAMRGIKTKVERYGTGSPATFGENAYSRVNRGYADDLPGLHFRSQWEANYARYLDWLKEKGEIADWAYEADRFIFDGVTTAPVTYTPDFRVVENSGAIVYHEVKGWMDGPSKSKLKRMKKFYPDVRVIVIDAPAYKAIGKWAALIPFWGEPVKERHRDEN